MKRFKKLMASIGTGLLLMAALVIGGSSPAFASAAGTISGDVQCSYQSSNSVVGIWVDAATGTDGWASLANDGNGGKAWSYNLSGTTSSYSLYIGCGGSSSQWASSFHTPSVTSNSYIYWYCVSGSCTQG